MRLRDWFIGSFSAGPGGPVRRWPPLAVELLEARCLPSYSITDLGTLGGTISDGNAINNRGVAVGESYLACGCTYHPYLWADGLLHDLGPGAAAHSINDQGQVAGQSNGHPFLWSRDGGTTDLGFDGEAYHINNRSEVVGQIYTNSHAFFWRDGMALDLGTLPGGGVSGANGINDQGQVVGQASGHAFLWTQGTGMRDLGSLDGNPLSSSGANAINDRGQIVGASYSQALHTSHAAYFSRSGVADLGTLGSYSVATGLNDLGQVVGLSAGPSGAPHAFLTDLSGGPMVDLNTLIPPDSGWTLFEANEINNRGQIVGTGQLPGNDIIHAYILTPEDSLVAILTAVVASGTGEVRTIPDSTTESASRASDSLAHQPAVEIREGRALQDVEAVTPPITLPVGSPTNEILLGQGWNDPLGGGSTS